MTTAMPIHPALASTDDHPLAPREPHFAAKAKRVIMIFMPGGVSHIDTFDPKPVLERDHGKSIRKSKMLGGSPWKANPYGDSGLQFTDLFPKLGSQADDLCLIRSMHGDKGDHFEATQSMHTGAKAGTLPSIGAWVSYALGTENPNLPSHVVFSESLPYGGSQAWDNNFLPAYHQGTRIIPGDTPIADLHPPADRAASQAREMALLRRLNQRHHDARPHDGVLAARMHSFDAALGLQNTAPDVLDLADESQETLDLYGVKENDQRSFAWQCLMARRMSQRGVRFIELIDRGASGNWDAHSNMKSYNKLASNTDQPIAALIQDLKRLGLLDETLIVWCTEFGRTPMVDPDKPDGRGHYKDAFTCWLAGGGVRGGYAHGSTDEYGIEIASDPVHIHDFHATILHLLGFDHERLTYFYSGRDFRLTGLAGEVVQDVIA